MNIISHISPLIGAYIASPLTGNWQLLKTLEKPAFLVRIINNTNNYIEVSQDGATISDYIHYGGTLQLNGQANALKTFTCANWGAGTTFYIRGAGNGRIYFAGYTYYR